MMRSSRQLSVAAKMQYIIINFSDNCLIVNIVNGIIILLEIFKANGFYTTKYLMSRYPPANC